MLSFDLNREVVQRAERFGFDFALSMIKLHGFGGPSRFWDYNLESFTLMAGLAPVTSRIRLFATCAVLTMPPPITARMGAGGSVVAERRGPGKFRRRDHRRGPPISPGSLQSCSNI
jgi:pyrimidine oxygenase